MSVNVKRFRKIQTSNPDLNKVQDNIGEVLNELLASPLARPLFRQGVAFLSGVNRISHGLGRRPLSVMLSPPSVGGVSFSYSQDPKDPTNYVQVTASGACTADLMVY